MREQAAELAATALQRTLAQLEEQVSTLSVGVWNQAAAIDQDLAVATFGRHELRSRAGLALPFYPALPRSPSLALDVMTRADALEFKEENPAGALGLLEPLTTAADETVRAAALLRVGRLHKKRGDMAKAIAAFDRLAALDTIVVDGRPAGLAGAQARALLFDATGRQADLAREATRIRQQIAAGHWPLSRVQYEFGVQQARAWLGGDEPAVEGDRLALAAAAEAVWNEWRRPDARASLERRRSTLRAGDRSVLVLTRGSPERLTVMLVGPRFLERHWREGARAAGRQEIDLALTDADGLTVLGDPFVPLERQSIRTASVTQLPWTVHAIARDTASPSSLSGPAALMLAGIVAMTLVVLTGGYFITRAMARELRVARLQSDFVSAVSHEFRTPLTTVRQLSELLARGRVSTEERRTEFYNMLLRESERLHRLVESLLNFARLEAGELEYRFETVEPGPFVRDLIRDFQAEVRGRDVRIELVGDADRPTIRADRELLARVFWNLLDNAVKYSLDQRDVRVDMEARGGRLLVRVRDRGMGIPAAEQQEIFGKFVRGAASKAASIAGTGIGLAMAREIVRAHGGDITVESEPGAGSTFTVALPVAEPASAPGRFATRAGVERARARWTLVGVGFTREKQDSRDKTQS